MKYFLLISLLLILTEGNAQEKGSESVVYKESLFPGDALIFGKRAVKFKEVVSDSRCPKGVTCLWAGEVSVRVEFFENGKSLSEKIIAGSGFPLNSIFPDINVGLSGFTVSPYPHVNRTIDPSEYILKLSMTEKLKE